MKSVHVMLVSLVSIAIGGSAALGEPNSKKSRPETPLGNNPNPVIWGGQQPKPAAPTPQPAAKPAADDHDGHHHGGQQPAYYPGVYGRVHRYDTYRVYGDPYYDFYDYPSFYYAYPPPIWIPAENVYGPQAMLRFMGVGGSGEALSPAGNPGLALRSNLDSDTPEPKGQDRSTNAQANALAWRFIGFGDAQFAQQKYVDANVRYRKAVSAAPQLADARFRQGFALAAIGRYEQAVAAMKRGLKLDPNWTKSGFDIKDLCGDDELVKDAYIDALATAADKNSNDANLLFLLGVSLHFDGQAERAKTFFDRAAKLAGNDAEHIRAFAKN